MRSQGIELWKIAAGRGGVKNFAGAAFRLLDVVNQRAASQVKTNTTGEEDKKEKLVELDKESDSDSVHSLEALEASDTEEPVDFDEAALAELVEEKKRRPAEAVLSTIYEITTEDYRTDKAAKYRAASQELLLSIYSEIVTEDVLLAEPDSPDPPSVMVVPEEAPEAAPEESPKEVQEEEEKEDPHANALWHPRFTRELEAAAEEEARKLEEEILGPRSRPGSVEPIVDVPTDFTDVDSPRLPPAGGGSLEASASSLEEVPAPPPAARLSSTPLAGRRLSAGGQSPSAAEA